MDAIKKLAKNKYINVVEECNSIILDYIKGEHYRRKVFPKDTRIKQELKKELLLYLNSIKYQKNLIKFIFIHSKDLNINNVRRS